MSSSSSSSSAASAAAVFPPSPQTQTPPPLLVENLPPLNQLSPVAAAAAAPASEQLCYVHCHFCDTVLVVSVPTSSLFKTVTVRCGHCSSLLTVNMRGLLFPGTPTTTTNTPTAAAAVTSSTITNNTAITTPPAPAPVSSVNNNNGHQFHFPNPSSLNNLAPNPPHHQSILDEISSANPSLQLLEHQQQHGLSGLIPGGARNTAAPAPLPPPPPPPSLNKGANKEPSPRTNNAVVNRPPEKRQRVPSAYNRFIKDEIQRIKAGNPDISHREAFSTAAKNWAHFPHIHFGLMPPDHHGLKRTNLLPQVISQDYQIRRDGLLKEEGIYAAAAANMGVAPY